MRPRRAQRILAAVLVAAGCGCGVPLDSTADSIPKADVPFGLADGDTGRGATGADQFTSADIYLVRDGRLWRVPRQIPSPPSAAAALGALADGPTSAEASLGLRTDIDDPAFIGNVREGGGLVQVDVSPDLLDLPSADQQLAIAQLVLTATAIESDSKVAFTVDSIPIDVPLPGGETTASPVDRAAFASMIGNP